MPHDPEERRQAFQRSLAIHGESPRALRWHGYRAAAQRYRQLVTDIDLTGKTVLDIGCGMGDLLPYLYAQTPDFTYRGIDVVPEFIEIARKRYDGYPFDVLDPFSQDLNETYDIVFCSGALNALTPNWQHDRQEMIKRLFGYTKETLVFNMAGSLEPAHASHNIGYANALEILRFCTELTPKVIFRNHYNRCDFTIALFRSAT